MLLPAVAFGEMTSLLLGAAARLSAGRLVCVDEGGAYSAGHVPFCGLAVIERLLGETAGIEDPFAYLVEMPGQGLQPHQDVAIEAAARLVEGVPS